MSSKSFDNIVENTLALEEAQNAALKEVTKKRKRVPTTLMMNKQLKELFKKHAPREVGTLSDCIEDLLIDFLKKHDIIKDETKKTENETKKGDKDEA